jgi:hypothetical protein
VAFVVAAQIPSLLGLEPNEQQQVPIVWIGLEHVELDVVADDEIEELTPLVATNVDLERIGAMANGACRTVARISPIDRVSRRRDANTCTDRLELGLDTHLIPLLSSWIWVAGPEGRRRSN